MADIERTAVLRFLKDLGTERIRLHHRSLLDHLVGTEQLLRDWKCPEEAALAGLCHAAYGTDGLVSPLVAPDDRARLRRLIGRDAESAVYIYGCCDRRAVYPQLGTGVAIRWRDRFTGLEWTVDDRDLSTFALLTWANALEAASAGTDADWSSVRSLFLLTADLVGPRPCRAAVDILGFDPAS
jgi:hypothetical protein